MHVRSVDGNVPSCLHSFDDDQAIMPDSPSDRDNLVALFICVPVTTRIHGDQVSSTDEEPSKIPYCSSIDRFHLAWFVCYSAHEDYSG